MFNVFDDHTLIMRLLFVRSFCWKCKFLRDCDRKNKKKDMADPVCFKSSRLHYLFEQAYGKVLPCEVEDQDLTWEVEA